VLCIDRTEDKHELYEHFYLSIVGITELGGSIFIYHKLYGWRWWWYEYMAKWLHTFNFSLFFLVLTLSYQKLGSHTHSLLFG